MDLFNDSEDPFLGCFDPLGEQEPLIFPFDLAVPSVSASDVMASATDLLFKLNTYAAEHDTVLGYPLQGSLGQLTLLETLGAIQEKANELFPLPTVPELIAGPFDPLNASPEPISNVPSAMDGVHGARAGLGRDWGKTRNGSEKGEGLEYLPPPPDPLEMDLEVPDDAGEPVPAARKPKRKRAGNKKRKKASGSATKKGKRNSGEPAVFHPKVKDGEEAPAGIPCPGAFWRSTPEWTRRRAVMGMRTFKLDKLKTACTGAGQDKGRWYVCKLEGEHHGTRLCSCCGKTYMRDRNSALIKDQGEQYSKKPNE